MGLFSIFLVGSETGSCFGAAKASGCFGRQQLCRAADQRLIGAVRIGVQYLLNSLTMGVTNGIWQAKPTGRY
jgi:hypothetical protein